MANFMIAYYGGNQPSSKEEGMAQMGKWKPWVEGLGDKIVNPGTPLMETKTKLQVMFRTKMIPMR
ncbi:hypothetical protein OAT11_02130 [Nitrospinaceae bacterium]|nr:hypothetical protein [Nitrospinaceae bacterium]